MNRKYKIGDRVVSNNHWGALPPGMVGTVVSYDGDKSYGVEFDDWEEGHTCRGLAKGFHGWYVGERILDPETPPAAFDAPSLELSDLFLGGGVV